MRSTFFAIEDTVAVNVARSVLTDFRISISRSSLSTFSSNVSEGGGRESFFDNVILSNYYHLLVDFGAICPSDEKRIDSWV